MNILITGHKGFIGSHLEERIGPINGIDIKDGNNILTCDLPDGIDTVIHLAAQSRVIPSIDDPVNDAHQNILGTIRLAKKYPNARFIFASSGGAIQKKIESPYGLSKYCAEKYIKLFCTNYAILRFPNIYGERSDSVVDKFIKNNPITIFGNGSATRDYVHVSDIVEAIMSALLNDHWGIGTFHLGSGKYHSVTELAKFTGKPITVADPIRGELQHTPTKNNVSWKPKIDVMDYMVEKLGL